MKESWHSENYGQQDEQFVTDEYAPNRLASFVIH